MLYCRNNRDLGVSAGMKRWLAARRRRTPPLREDIASRCGERVLMLSCKRQAVSCVDHNSVA